MEKDRVASGVETFKLSPLGDMRTAYPCPLGRFLPSVIPSRPEDLPVDLEQGIDEVLLEPLVGQVLA